MTRSEIPWLADAMDDSTNLAFGKPYNGEFVVDPKGKIVRQRFWSNPITLRKDLEQLVGPVANPTDVSDVAAKFRTEKREVASGVVPRIALPAGLKPLQVAYEPSQSPAFFKLRAELLRKQDDAGQYKLFLGFYPDPIYKVHWNNAAGPIAVVLEAVDALGLTETSLAGPEVDVAADLDPRMFLVDLPKIDSKAELTVELKAVVCDDAETFCHPITQRFVISLAKTTDGSSRPGVFLTRIFADVRQFDKNGDRRVTPEELPPNGVTMFMTHIDTNLDNVMTFDEIRDFEAMYHDGKGINVENGTDGS